MIKIQSYQEHDLPQVLKILEQSDSTSRTQETWRGNDMTGVLAFDEKNLIGAIPFEKRQFVLCHETIPVLWASGVHVQPEYRSRGIGSAMDEKIKEFFSSHAQAVLVFREDETSPAYRWYKKLGYYDLVPILAYKKDVTASAGHSKYEVWQTPAEVRAHQQEIWDCFEENRKDFVGFPKRHPQFWSQKLEYHYYKKFYVYYILALIEADKIIGYSLLGKTAMRDGINRFDILEFISSDDEAVRNKLYNAIENFAGKLSLKEIRIQVAHEDPNLNWLKSLGFSLRWRTNILGKFIHPISFVQEQLAKIGNLREEFSFIWKTPKLGEQTMGQGKNTLSLFSSDETLHKILFSRCDLDCALKGGSLVILGGEEKVFSLLKKSFPLKLWRYFHIDYI